MVDNFLSAGALGQSALLSCLFSFVIQFLCLIPAYQKKNHDSFLAIAKAGALFQFMMMSVGLLALIMGYVTNDFSLKNVFENSHTETPLIYRITGAWGNHEGSMLLWLWLMSFFGLLIGGKKRSDFRKIDEASVVVFVSLRQGIYQVLFLITLLYVLLLSNPFQALKGMVSQGLELNPILQDPALAIHPPALYTGYVGFGVVYVMAFAGALSGVRESFWLRDLQKWTLGSWTFLTLGIALGSWWAYYELGWGGWWFWDPVENASLMPWLSATALLHLITRARQNGDLLTSTYFLGVLTYCLCLLGTFLVRSGSLSSVHAFAQDPGRGLAIISFTSVAVFLALIGLYMLRKNAKQKNDEGSFYLFSLRGAFSLQTLLFMTLLITVILGTTYPLFIEAITGKSLSVGAPYFHKTFVPVCFGVFILMGVSLFLPKIGTRISGKNLWKLVERPALMTVLWMIAWAYFVTPLTMTGLLGSSASFWIICTTLQDFRSRKPFSLRKYALFCSHVGVAVMVFGMTVDHSFRQENTVALAIGEKVKFHNYEISLIDVERVREHTFMGERGLVEVRQDKKMIASLRPEKRFYPSHQVLTTETALYPHGLSNLYVALGGVLPGDKWTLRLYHHPFVLCLWIGAVLMALGGSLALASYLKLRKIRIRIGKYIDA